MPGTPQAAVTPSGIRDGDPAELAALVERRANAVVAYCEAVCPPGAAVRAAAEAFARFRAAVAAAQDARGLDPERLLLSATRHAAASLTPVPAPPAPTGLRGRLGGGRGRGAAPCDHVPGLLAARAEGSLEPGDLERLEQHLERHPECRALADAVARADAAFASPPARTLPIGTLHEIVLALTAAAPITAHSGTEPDEVAEPDAASAAPDEPGSAGRSATVAAPAPGGAAGGVPLPRPARGDAPTSTGGHGVVFRWVLPGVLVLVTLLGALGVAGVFAADRRDTQEPAPATAPAPPARR